MLRRVRVPRSWGLLGTTLSRAKILASVVVSRLTVCLTKKAAGWEGMWPRHEVSSVKHPSGTSLTGTTPHQKKLSTYRMFRGQEGPGQLGQNEILITVLLLPSASSDLVSLSSVSEESSVEQWEKVVGCYRDMELGN